MRPLFIAAGAAAASLLVTAPGANGSRAASLYPTEWFEGDPVHRFKVVMEARRLAETCTVMGVINAFQEFK